LNMQNRIAYLGPPGTFAEEAALLYDKEAQLIPFPTVSGVAAAVTTGMTDEGVVPIENSLEGPATDTLDLLIQEDSPLIKRELVIPIQHHLVARPNTQIQDVEALFCHPQALGQCRRFVERCFPKTPVVAALSNAAAVEQMMSHPKPAVAIGPRRAALLYGAEILAESIQDRFSNVTRFVVLARTDNGPTGCDKTSFCFSFSEDHSGLLYKVIKVFADRNINLTKVESRPTKESLGQYIFLIDFEGHRQDAAVTEVLKKVRSQCDLFKIFGSYPRYQGKAE
jgi:prephenate dehydratase